MARKVLIVDDDEINNYLCERIITITNFSDDIVALTTVDKAIAYLNDHRNNEDELPEIIFLDINMPKKNGWDFLNEYGLIEGSIKKKIKIFMLSSSVYERDIELANSSSSVTDYITKPLNKEVLKRLELELI